MKLPLLILLTIAIPCHANAATKLKPIQGVASVIDGDTIEIHGKYIRFLGIDAPEHGQPCYDVQEQPYRCGQNVAFALSDKIGIQTVNCVPKNKDRYQRIVATCYLLDGTDLNQWMVEEGYAVAYRQYSKKYVPMEQGAKAAEKGIWAGSFTMPAEWRKAKREKRLIGNTY